MDTGHIVAIISACLGSSGLCALIIALLQRKWTKDDRVDALVNAQKVIMIDRVRFISKQHISEGFISLEDKETIKEMFDAYKALGGNGHLNTIMSEVDKLKVVQ